MLFKSFTIESGGVNSRGRHYVSGVFEELVHLVERDVAVDDDQVVAAVLNKDNAGAHNTVIIVLNKDNGANNTVIMLSHEQIICCSLDTDGDIGDGGDGFLTELTDEQMCTQSSITGLPNLLTRIIRILEFFKSDDRNI